MKALTRAMQFIFYGLVILVVALVILRLTPVWDSILSAGAVQQVKFSELRTTKKPNWFLVCEENICADQKISMPSPIFPKNAAELKATFKQMLVEDGNAEIRLETDQQLEVLIRTPLIRWPDLVSIQFVDKGENSSTLYLFSRSIYGHSDLGANKNRVEGWLKRLQQS